MTNEKIYLLNLPPALESRHSSKGAIYPSTAILLLGTILRQAGYEVAIIDGAFHENYLDILQKELLTDHRSPVFIGMTVMTTQIPMALEAARAIKTWNRNIPIVWGGPHPTLFPQETLLEDSVDIVAINEGGATALNLADCLKDRLDLGQVPGIGYKDKNDPQKIVITQASPLEDIQRLPHFDFSLLDVNSYLQQESDSPYQREFPNLKDKIRIMPILTGLGCPYQCQFCINVILKRRYRFRSAESIVAEVKFLQDRYDANTFLFLDEDFFISKKRAFQFLDLVESQKLHFNWRMWCRVDHFRDDFLNAEVIRRLGDIGYGSLVMGGESANPEILTLLKKGTTPEQILHSLRMLTGSKIFARYSFMVGLENERMDQIKRTLKFCLKMKEINPQVDIAVFPFRLYPGSPIYNRIVQNFKLKMPNTMQSWVAYLHQEVTYTEMPWTPREFQSDVEKINFYAHHALTAATGQASGWRGWARTVLQQLARLRLKYFFLKLPAEYALQRVYQRAKHIAWRRIEGGGPHSDLQKGTSS
ncbi:MAG: B12-binding domain-containing radical SAM protein [Syntrophobacterales bacterium]|jgi:radical SAM superfamily enzyme YgiQ (UPF0313 family)|nr:B12-binding domain-containing radical SAM protein [Syntrophobacterales bacterium]